MVVRMLFIIRGAKRRLELSSLRSDAGPDAKIFIRGRSDQAHTEIGEMAEEKVDEQHKSHVYSRLCTAVLVGYAKQKCPAQ
jgi:hypothetical protein